MACGSQKRALDLLELELQAAMTWQWLLGPEPGSSARVGTHSQPLSHLSSPNVIIVNKTSQYRHLWTISHTEHAGDRKSSEEKVVRPFLPHTLARKASGTLLLFEKKRGNRELGTGREV